MKRSLAAALIALLVAAIAPVAHTDTTRLSLARVRYDSPAEAGFLLSNYDETHNHSMTEIEIVAWPGDLAELDAYGYDYRVVVDDLVAQEIAYAKEPHPLIHMPGPDYSDYRRLPDYNNEMQDLAKKHSDLVEVFEMKRPTLEGRPVYGIEVSANVKNHDDGKPIFYIDGVHHAREWPASEYTMIFAHYLVDGFGKDPKITSLLKRERVIFVPIVNVDGFDYSRESVLSLTQQLRDGTDETGAVNGFEGYWRKNRRSPTGVTIPGVQRNPEAWGVDPNRNYSYLWGDNQGGSSGDVYDQTYRGEAPFSEPETQNVRDIILSRNVTTVLTNHTFQGSVLRAGGGESPEDGMLESIGDRLAKVLGYNNAPTVGYPTTGTTDDWAYAVMGAIGFTIEHGVINFHPAYADEIGAHLEQHMEAFSILAEVAADPRYHSVLTGRVTVNGKPSAADLTLTKKFKTPLSEGNPTGEKSVTEKLDVSTKAGSDGMFEWHVSPSFRPYEKKFEAFTLTIKAGGKTKVLTVKLDRGQVLNLGTIAL
ncbi:MAG: hypothetical protein QOG54_247 [Actinomycetota bacterium]|jgi:hypothetical protein|nr:hypothetical protein [Actinomycetota bacterium]